MYHVQCVIKALGCKMVAQERVIRRKELQFAVVQISTLYIPISEYFIMKYLGLLKSGLIDK